MNQSSENERDFSNTKWVKVSTMFPTSRKSRYTLHCSCCNKPIKRGQMITRAMDGSCNGVELRSRVTNNGGTYKLFSGETWVHRDCNPPGCWTEYSAEQESIKSSDDYTYEYIDYYDEWELNWD